jgi:dUTP pyrophosphatase
MEKVPVQVKRLRGGRWPIPTPATDYSAGVDLYADVDGSLELTPGQTAAVPTGIAIALPRGWEAQVRPRSGLALKHSLGLLNSPGTIDADYRGEIKVIVTNFGKDVYRIQPGERIAQMVFKKVYHAEWIVVDDLPNSERGSGGFGHSGK